MSAPEKRRSSTLRQMRLVSIGTLIVALFTLGLILLIRIVALGLGQNIKENISLTIELSGDDARSRFTYLQTQLGKLSGIKSVEYIDAEDAAKQLAQQLGENPVDVLGYNPLNSVAKLTLHADYMQPDSLTAMEKRLSMLGIDAKLDYRGDLLSSVEGNTRRIEWVLWALLVMQSIFAYIQISNTTRLAIYADRLKIRTLTLVGASSWFIRRPIIGRSLIDALVASVVALGLLAGLASGLRVAIGIDLLSLLTAPRILIAVAMLLAVAMLSCALASARAAQRYIRMDGSKIHLV